MSDRPNISWVEFLSDSDLGFVRRFVLSSGSLKKMAAEYSVSYPTVRRRLDRIIAKIAAIESTYDLTDFERVVTVLAAEGRIDTNVQKELLDAYKKEKKQ